MSDASPPDDAGRVALPLDEAAARISAAIVAVEGRQRVALAAALGRVLAYDLLSTIAVPGHDNAAMDGYALRVDDPASPPDFPLRLRIVGQSRAGHPYPGRTRPGECVRILTGAVMPDDCDAVVPQELVRVDDDVVTIARAVTPGQNRRLAGEDLQPGTVVITAGRRLTPSDLGLAASVGRDALDVRCRPRVAVFSTGNELRGPGRPLERGTIHDSNRHTLIGLLTQLDVDVVDLGIVGDDPAALRATIEHACGTAVRADAIVTSGGVSAGDADHTREVIGELGSVAFWKLAIKPGRPMAFGRVAAGGRSALLFGLPGNPVAVMVVFHALVRDALLRLMGAHAETLLAITATSDAAIDKVVGRSEFVRGVAWRDAAGWRVRPTGAQGSGILRSMSEANCLVVLDPARGPVAPGETVEAWPLRSLQ